MKRNPDILKQNIDYRQIIAKMEMDKDFADQLQLFFNWAWVRAKTGGGGLGFKMTNFKIIVNN